MGIEAKLKSIKTRQFNDGFILSNFQFNEKGEKTDIKLPGTLYVDQLLLRLETHSLELAEFAVAHLKETLGGALKFKHIVKIKMNMDTSDKIKTSAEELQPSSPLKTAEIKKVEEK